MSDFNLSAELYRLAEEVHKCALVGDELVTACWSVSRHPSCSYDGSAIFELVKQTYDREFAPDL